MTQIGGILFSTRKPYSWESYTENPWDIISIDDYDSKRSSNNTGIIFFWTMSCCVLIGAILVCICKHFVCEKDNRHRNASRISHFNQRIISPRTQHPENILEFTPHPAFRPSILNESPMVNSATTAVDGLPVLIEATSINTEINRSSVVEQPPGYSDVVLDDLYVSNKYPVVGTTVPETPPPMYYEENVIKF